MLILPVVKLSNDTKASHLHTSVKATTGRKRQLAVATHPAAHVEDVGHRAPASTHCSRTTNRAGAIIAATAGAPEPAADAPEPAVTNVSPMRRRR
jgi:hypothetical protein